MCFWINGKNFSKSSDSRVAVTREEQKEMRLQSKDFSTSGLIFALKNQDGWRDEKHIQVDQKTEQKISLSIDPNTELGKSLMNSGNVTLEAEFEALTED